MLSIALLAALAAPAQSARLILPDGLADANSGLPSLFTTDDYPAAAIRGNQQGTVEASLTINREGRISACEITRHASALLDVQTCTILATRARFQPARDKRGRPVEDKNTVRIRWVLPEERGKTGLPDSIDTLLTLSPDGRVTSCEGHLVTRGVEVPEATKAICDDVRSAPTSDFLEAAAMSNKPVPRIRWSWHWMPANAASFPKPGQGAGERLLSSRTLAVTFDDKGKKTSCQTETSSGSLGMSFQGDCDKIPAEVDTATLRAKQLRLETAFYLYGE